MSFRFGRARNKYNAQSADGFPSKLEASVYYYLKRREMVGEICDIERQQIIVLQDGPREEKITWRVDFAFIVVASGERELGEAKGFPDDVYKLKLKLFRRLAPHALEIYGGTHERIKLIERIEKKG